MAMRQDPHTGNFYEDRHADNPIPVVPLTEKLWDVYLVNDRVCAGPLSNQTLSIRDQFGKMAEAAITYVLSELARLSDRSEEPEKDASHFAADAVTQEQGAKALPESANLEGYDPQAIFSRVSEIRKQRTAQYANTKVLAHRTLGSIIKALVEQRYRITLEGEPGADFGALVMVALKLQRAALPGIFVQDTYDDMLNYAAIAEECAHAEQFGEDCTRK